MATYQGLERPIHPETGRPETEQERVDRNLQEMLGELRVALPGVQVLFAFLLVYGSTTTAVTAPGVAIAFALLWYAIPLRRLARRPRATSGRL